MGARQSTVVPRMCRKACSFASKVVIGPPAASCILDRYADAILLLMQADHSVIGLLVAGARRER
jgi:hypothetical protein